MPKNFKSILIAATLLAVTACHSKQAPAPQDTEKAAAPSAPVAAPAAPEAPPPAPPAAPKAATMDGSWTGNSGEDLPLNFTVKGDQVSQVNASYKQHQNGCSSFASFSSKETATLNGKSFTVHGTNDMNNDHIEFSLSGSFTSDKEASGTIHWTGKSNMCGPVDVQAKWTAKKDSDSGDSPDSVDEN
ncbi:MAG: hypothetical protein K8R69_02845 [Deltaproteobacteria bacterium]|nr:hypothetical protein [Deltaproteobacteria bacterium]